MTHASQGFWGRFASAAAVWVTVTTVMSVSVRGEVDAATLDDLRPLVTTRSWTERRPAESGEPQTHEVTAEIWTAAFQRRIDETKRLEIPARGEPYYIDEPLVLPSGATIVASPKAEIRLVPGVNTCLVRNANLLGFARGPVPADSEPDTDITVEDVVGSPPGASPNNAIRLLPGVKTFADGTVLACPIRDITLRRITDITEFKCYDQPNLEVPAGTDLSDPIGKLENIRFEQLTFNRPGTIELHADADGLTIEGVSVAFDPPPDWHVLAIGPKSMTSKGNEADPAKWREVFSPDRDCTVRDVSISGVRRAGAREDLPINRLIKVIELQPNPDYPKTTPKGGTGKGIWIR